MLKDELSILRLVNYEPARICTDTRTIKEGDFFVALKGERFDGNNFVPEAVKKGACGILTSKHSYIGGGFNIPVLYSRDTLRSYGNIARLYRYRFDIPIIGVTGSNGKTTTKEMIYCVLSKRLRVLKNEGTENNLVGLPRSLLRLNRGHQVAVLEMGSNRPGEILRLSKILRPSIGVITNIGPSHLESLKDLESVFEEKSALARLLRRDGTLYLNVDDPYLYRLLNTGCKVVRIGINKTESEYYAHNIKCKRNSLEFEVNGQYRFRLNLLGTHNIYNALFAIALGFHFGVSYSAIYSALCEFMPQRGRLELKRKSHLYIIDDTYNANPVSTTIALNVLSNYSAKGRRIFVFGDMMELGQSARKFHRRIGQLVKASNIDYLLTVGELSKWTAKEAVKAGMREEAVFECKDLLELISMLRQICEKSDIILLKGSRRNRLERIYDAL